MLKRVLSYVTVIISTTTLCAATTQAKPHKSYAEMGIMQGSPPKKMIDKANWDKGPENRWAFQHISQILPTATISRGTQKPSQLPRATQNLSDFIFTNHDGNKISVQQMLDDTYTDGFIVLHDGKVVFEKYYNGLTPDTRHLLMSVSKSVLGVAIGKLVEENRLDPYEEVTYYIPELRKSSAFLQATVREILDMTTSIVFSEIYEKPQKHIGSHDQASAWRGLTPVAQNGLYAFAQTMDKDKHEHGELFQYASINADVLGWLAERTSGQSYNQFLSQALWAKLGAEHDAQISVDYLGSAVANSGLCTTLRDLARFGQMVLDNGFYNGQQIIPAKWMDDIRSNGNNAAWLPTEYGKLWPEGFYRNQWYVTNDDQGCLFAIGINGQHIWINPTTKTVIVKFSSHPQAANVDATMMAITGMDAIAKMLGEKNTGKTAP